MTTASVDRPTRITVDLAAIAHNARAIAAHTKRPVMAIVKANAYGHGLVAVARHLEKTGAAQALGVAFAEEGIALRRAGITLPILVLGGIYSPQVAQFISHDLALTVSSIDKLHQVEAAATQLGKKARIHLKIDTGMERIGVHAEHAEPFIEAALRAHHCVIEGVYSHLACADEPGNALTHTQLERFNQACAHFQTFGAPMPLRHLANSGGVLHFPATWADMVRPGLALYGVLPDATTQDPIGLRPALQLTSRVVYFKVVEAGRSVSYGATWVAPVQTRMATIPIGYGDGWPRALSSRGEVLIRGVRLQIAGRVCMDQFMVDVGAAGTAYNGDEVVLLGEQNGARIRCEEVAAQAGTVPWEILVGLNERIPRDYVGGSPENIVIM